MIDELLNESGLELRGLDGIAYGEGPGSFTGLRIACGVVQGLAFGADLPVVGIGTLIAMAEGSGAEHVACCLDARMNEVYFAAYVRLDTSWRTVHPPRVCAPDALPDLPGGGWMGCGSGFAAYGGILAARYGDAILATDAPASAIARDIATLAALQLPADAAAYAEHAIPVYIRDKVALRIDERPNR